MTKSRDLFLRGQSPSHHQFGTSQLIETGEYKVDYFLVAPKVRKNKFLKLISIIPIWIKTFFKARKYDIVYGAADFTVDFLGMLKKAKLFRPKLIAIFHHPPFEQKLKVEKFDKILFLSHYALEDISSKFPNLRQSMEFFQWGPDLDFYKRIEPVPNYQKNKKELIFISNGKTHRDHETLFEAAVKTGNKTIIVSDEWSLPLNFNKLCKNVEIFYQNKPDDTKMLKLLSNCSVLVIPTFPDNQRLGPIGLTSFVDAIAMGIPIISANNTVFDNIIIEHKMGLVYEAGNPTDLGRVMDVFKENPELVVQYGKNAFNFGQTHDIKAFGMQLYHLLHNI